MLHQCIGVQTIHLCQNVGKISKCFIDFVIYLMFERDELILEMNVISFTFMNVALSLICRTRRK